MSWKLGWKRENEVLLVENYTSTQLEPGICSFPQKTWEIHIFTILLHFLRIKHWLTWNQLSWNLFLPADFVRLEQRREEPFLLFDLKRQNLKQVEKSWILKLQKRPIGLIEYWEKDGTLQKKRGNLEETGKKGWIQLKSQRRFFVGRSVGDVTGILPRPHILEIDKRKTSHKFTKNW